MKNRKILRALLCLMVLALCAGVFPGRAAANENTDPFPVFDLTFDTDDGAVVYSAFCVRDPSTGNVYLISAAEAADWVDGSNVTLTGPNYSEEAEHLQTVGLIAYFWAPGLDVVEPLELGGPIEDSVVVNMLVEDDGELFLAVSDPVDLTNGWKNHGQYWLYDAAEETTDRVGAAALTEDGSYVVGMVTRNEENALAILSLDGTFFPEDNAVVNADGEVVKVVEEEEEGNGVSPAVIVGIVLAVAVVAFFVVSNNKKKKAKEAEAAKDSGSGEIKEATVPMKHNELSSDLVDFPSTQPVKGGAVWQLRCVRGPLEGKVFPLQGRLTIGRAAGNDIQFPEGTKGVSGRHCQVTFAGDRVVIQDLNATYGTYFGMDHKAKLNANMEYQLRSGDVFVLAEGGPAFRLEKLGVEKANFALRNAAGMVYKPNGDGEITIGRAGGSVVAYDPANGSISGRHAKLFMKDDAVYLMDLGSTNGTFFNENQRLKPNVAYKVANGTRFYLVDERNTFVVTME